MLENTYGFNVLNNNYVKSHLPEEITNLVEEFKDLWADFGSYENILIFGNPVITKQIIYTVIIQNQFVVLSPSNLRKLEKIQGFDGFTYSPENKAFCIHFNVILV